MYKQIYLNLNQKALMITSGLLCLYVGSIIYLNSMAENYFVYEPNTKLQYHNIDHDKKQKMQLQIENALDNAEIILGVALHNDQHLQGGSDE